MATRPGSKILYSSIVNRDLTLVSHQVDTVDYSTSLEEIRASIIDLHLSPSEQKLTFPVQNFQVHVLVERGIVYLCITERTNSHYLPFTFLYRVRDTFAEQPSLVSRSYRASEDEFDRDFGPVLIKIMDDFNSGRADGLSAVEAQIQDVKKIMLDNVEKAMDRADRLDDLLAKTEELEAGGQEFRRQARVIHVQARCRHLKLWLMIGAASIIFITVIILYMTGLIHPADKPPSP